MKHEHFISECCVSVGHESNTNTCWARSPCGILRAKNMCVGTVQLLKSPKDHMFGHHSVVNSLQKKRKKITEKDLST